MGKVARRLKRISLDEVKAAIAFEQPRLMAVENGGNIVVSGAYLLVEDGAAINPAGPITSFDVKIIVPPDYPRSEPKVFEVGDRIPRCADRHINPDGDCCVTVWEHWLATADDQSFADFLSGPLYEYFLSQYWFERTGTWAFGERAHGARGLHDAYAEVLVIADQKVDDVVYFLRLLSQDWPKGHWLCPCGSGKILRFCHRQKVLELHERVTPGIANRMLQRLKRQS